MKISDLKTQLKTPKRVINQSLKRKQKIIEGKDTKKRVQETREQLINNITNTMSDRCAANHAAIRVVNREWGKTLNKLNCHLHPLDSISSSVRSALKQQEETSQGKVFGKDCLAANVILQMNKLRYKNAKGDPRGVVAFLDDRHIPRGVLPRYRGNRLHIIFHIGGKLLEHYDDFVALLWWPKKCHSP